MTSHHEDDSRFEALTGYAQDIADIDVERRARSYLEVAIKRRSVRSFSDRPVPRSIIEACLAVAKSAPSGANQQPWHFAAVGDPAVKREIRLAAEEEEREFYHRRAPEEWLDALAPLGTDEHKPFLEVAPWLIAIFAQPQGDYSGQRKVKHYYVTESVGIATGMLIAALNHCGLATLTHTPSPMRFLNNILRRPANERPFVLLVVGFPAADCQVPKIQKKTLEQVSTFFE